MRVSPCGPVRRAHSRIPFNELGLSTMTNDATMSWTNERVESLRQHWHEGKSASQIASLLGHGLTRNAVIGKVHRLGLAGRAKSPGTVPPRPREAPALPIKAHRPTPRVVHGATALAVAPEPLVEVKPQTFETMVIPMSVRVTIVDLKEAMCRWPLGDPASSDFRYCGSQVSSGPYCAYHGGLAYQPAHDRRRERDRQRAPTGR